MAQPPEVAASHLKRQPEGGIRRNSPKNRGNRCFIPWQVLQPKQNPKSAGIDGAMVQLPNWRHFKGFAWYPVRATFKTNVKHIDFRFARFQRQTWRNQLLKGRCDVSPEVSSSQKLAPSICALSYMDAPSTLNTVYSIFVSGWW